MANESWDSELLNDAVKLIGSHFQFYQDAPYCIEPFYKSAASFYPSAKFILTVRDSQSWWTSIKNWIKELKPWNTEKYARMLGANAFDEKSMIDAFERYNKNVIDYFTA